MSTTSSKNIIFWNLLSSGVISIIQLFQIYLIGKFILPDVFGVYSFGLTIVGVFLLLGDFGTYNYLTRKSNLDKHCFNQTIRLVLKITSILLILSSIISVLLYFYKGSFDLAICIFILGFTPIFMGLSQIFTAVLARTLKFKLISIIEITSTLMSLVIFLIMLYFGYSLESLSLSFLSAFIFRFIFLILLFFFTKGIFLFDENGDMHGIRDFTIFASLDRLINYCDSNADKVIVPKLYDMHHLGVYSQVWQLTIKPIAIINTIFTKSMLPILASDVDNNKKLSSKYLEWLKLISLCVLPSFLFLEFTSESLFKTLFNSQWVEGSPELIRIFSLIGLFWSIGNPIGVIVNVKAETRMGSYFSLISFVIHSFLILIVYITSGDILDFAHAVLFSAFIMFIAEFQFRYKLLGMSIKEYFKYMWPVLFSFLSIYFLHYFWLSEIDFTFLESVFLFFIGISLFGLFNFLVDKKVKLNTYLFINSILTKLCR